MNKIEVDKDSRDFKVSVDWMRNKYGEMNQILFDGLLGDCDFDIFTKGKGSEGGVLGYFKLCGEGLKADRRTGRIYMDSYYSIIEVNSGNFVKLCKPLIVLNGNYIGTEYGFLVTLIHEMCHYYTYMRGIAPSRGHGSEFYRIGSIVSNKSGGLFTIERLSTAEQMSNLELNDDMKAKKEKRMANKKSSIFAVFEYRYGNKVNLTTTSSQELINKICNFNGRNFVEKVIITNDIELIEFLFEKGYTKNFRVWRYWDVSNESWLSKLDSISNKQVIKNTEYLSEHNIRNRSREEIINEVINRFIKEKDDFVEINSDMNLGISSPFEEASF